MNTTLIKRAFTICSISLVLAGCGAAKMSVYHVDGTSEATKLIKSKQGVFYTLPKTVLQVSVPYKKYIFSAGEFDQYVDNPKIVAMGIKPLRLSRAKFKSASCKDLSTNLGLAHALGDFVKEYGNDNSLRLSDLILDIIHETSFSNGSEFGKAQKYSKRISVGNEISSIDNLAAELKILDNEIFKPVTKETRYKLSEINISTTAKPDPDQVYFAELEARHFENLGFQTSFTIGGTPVKQSAAIENKASDLALVLASYAISKAAPIIGESLYLSTDIDKPIKAKGLSKDAQFAIQRITGLRSKREDIIYGKEIPSYLSGDDLQAALSTIDLLEQNLVAKFSGSIKTLDQIEVLEWEPAKQEKPTETALFRFDACTKVTAIPDKDTSKLGPNEYKLKITVNADSATILKRIEEATKPDISSELGLRYRIPAMVTAALIKSSTLPKVITQATLPIAQFGIIAALPAGIGGKSSIEVELYEDLGALKVLTVSATGNDPAPIVESFKESIDARDPIEQLKRKKEFLQLEKDILELETE